MLGLHLEDVMQLVSTRRAIGYNDGIASSTHSITKRLFGNLHREFKVFRVVSE